MTPRTKRNDIFGICRSESIGNRIDMSGVNLVAMSFRPTTPRFLASVVITFFSQLFSQLDGELFVIAFSYSFFNTGSGNFPSYYSLGSGGEIFATRKR